MIDLFLNLADTVAMLTTAKIPTKQAAPASHPGKASLADLEFLSANQQLEGFPGKITEEVAAHQPDLETIAESARRFGAQIPSKQNRKQRPVFPQRRS